MLSYGRLSHRRLDREHCIGASYVEAVVAYRTPDQSSWWYRILPALLISLTPISPHEADLIRRS